MSSIIERAEIWTMWVAATVRRGQFAAMKAIWGQQHPNYGPLIKRAQRDRMYPEAVKLALQMERGLLGDNTFGATHFYLAGSRIPAWTADMHYLVTVKSHHFFTQNRPPEVVAHQAE